MHINKAPGYTGKYNIHSLVLAFNQREYAHCIEISDKLHVDLDDPICELIYILSLLEVDEWSCSLSFVLARLDAIKDKLPLAKNILNLIYARVDLSQDDPLLEKKDFYREGEYTLKSALHPKISPENHFKKFCWLNEDSPDRRRPGVIEEIDAAGFLTNQLLAVYLGGYVSKVCQNNHFVLSIPFSWQKSYDALQFEKFAWGKDRDTASWIIEHNPSPLVYPKTVSPQLTGITPVSSADFQELNPPSSQVAKKRKFDSLAGKESKPQVTNG